RSPTSAGATAAERSAAGRQSAVSAAAECKIEWRRSEVAEGVAEIADVERVAAAIAARADAEVEEPAFDEREKSGVRGDHSEHVAKPHAHDVKLEQQPRRDHADDERGDQDQRHVNAKREALLQPCIDP